MWSEDAKTNIESGIRIHQINFNLSPAQLSFSSLNIMRFNTKVANETAATLNSISTGLTPTFDLVVRVS